MRILLAAALALGAPAAGAAPHQVAGDTGLGIRLVDAPTALRDDPRARIYIVDHVAPGETIRRHVAVSDNTPGPLSASLYVGGASVDGGSFDAADRGAPSELGSWSSISPTSVALKAGESKTAEVTISVPRGVPDGERYGVIWAELPPSGGAVKTVNRVGVRIYLSVGTGKTPPSDFSVTQLQAQRDKSGTPLVVATVKNTGQRALDMSGSLSLKNGPGGLNAGPFAATLGTTLAIGDTEPVQVVLAKAITGGPWTAELTMRSGEIVHTVTAKLTFPDAGAPDPAPVKATPKKTPKELPAVASIAAVLILLLLLGIGYAYLRSRRVSDGRPSAA